MWTSQEMARLAGLEPATPGLEGRCSIRLSYKRKLVGVEGFEPPTSCSQSRRATKLRYTPTTFFVNGLLNFSTTLEEMTMIRGIPYLVNHFLIIFIVIFQIKHKSLKLQNFIITFKSHPTACTTAEFDGYNLVLTS
jgi:hypothetical protein